MMGVNMIERDSPVYHKWKRHVLTRVKSAKGVIIKFLCSLHTTSTFVAAVLRLEQHLGVSPRFDSVSAGKYEI